VAILGGYEILRRLLHDLGAVTATDQRHRLAHVRDGLLDGVGVRLLDLLALPGVSERPSHRHGLRCAEHAVDPTATRTVRTRSPQPLAGAGMLAFY
jgi:hypothetical protein